MWFMTNTQNIHHLFVFAMISINKTFPHWKHKRSQLNRGYKSVEIKNHKDIKYNKIKRTRNIRFQFLDVNSSTGLPLRYLIISMT